MYTIWFSLIECPIGWQFLHLEVNTTNDGIKHAQDVWDKLKAGGFYMKSARP
jgi:uncharacterized protein YbdZ (MbtH family)